MRIGAGMVAALALAVSAGGAQAQDGRGRYGGGFIEYLMTGGGPAPAYRSGPRLADDVRIPPIPAAYGGGGPEGARTAYARPVPTRLAALPADPGEGDGRIARTLDPRYGRQVVAFEGRQRPGTIVIDSSAKFLYLVQPGGQAIRYGIGVGRPGFAWTGVKTISQKREWPDWTPPAEMLARRPDLPRHMEGGPENPLGARAMYLGSSLYRIHGTNEPHTIGQNVSSGCIRMMNEDVVDLYERTPVGTRVEVL